FAAIRAVIFRLRRPAAPPVDRELKPFLDGIAKRRNRRGRFGGEGKRKCSGLARAQFEFREESTVAFSHKLYFAVQIQEVGANFRPPAQPARFGEGGCT